MGVRGWKKLHALVVAERDAYKASLLAKRSLSCQCIRMIAKKACKVESRVILNSRFACGYDEVGSILVVLSRASPDGSPPRRRIGSVLVIVDDRWRGVGGVGAEETIAEHSGLFRFMVASDFKGIYFWG